MDIRQPRYTGQSDWKEGKFLGHLFWTLPGLLVSSVFPKQGCSVTFGATWWHLCLIRWTGDFISTKGRQCVDQQLRTSSPSDLYASPHYHRHWTKKCQNKTDLNCQQCPCQIIVGYSLHNTATTRTNNKNIPETSRCKISGLALEAGVYIQIFLLLDGCLNKG